MEELAAAPPPLRHHRVRRHRRRASDSAAAAYADVFGGPPRFAGVPADYADVFGGVAASCSIPYLDLPPAAADGAGAGAGSDPGAYGEIFARFDFGEFAAPYEDVFAEADGVAEEITSWSGSSRSSMRKESGELDAEPSLLYQHYPNVGYDQHFDEEQFSPISFPPDGEQQFSMSYNKATRGRLDDLVEMTTCMVEPSINYVVDSCNLSNDSATNHVPVMDNGALANGEKKEMSPPASDAVSDSVADQTQHIPTCLPISENLYEDESEHKRSSTHSASSEEVPSPDYPFLRVSNIGIQTLPIKVQPPSVLPSNLLNKKENKANGDSEVNPNSAAAAAIKEAMEFAEARLKAAKELMERKGNSCKLRKRPGHRRGKKSTEIKENKTPEEVHVFEEKLTLRRLAKEEKNCEDLALLDNNRDSSAVKLGHCYHDKKGVQPLGKPHQMMQSGNKLDQLGKWASGAEFYEVISHDQKCTTNTAACEGDNGLTTNPFTKHSQSEKGKEGVTAGDLERDGKLWDGDDITELRVKHVNLREDTASMEVEHKAPTAPEVSSWEERVAYQTTDSHIEEYVGVGNSPEGHDDGVFEISCINGRSPKLHIVPEISSLSLEPCIAGGHANSNKNCSDASTEETPLVGKSNEDNNSKEGLEIPCADGKLWDGDDITELRVKHVNLREDTASMEVEHKAPTAPEVSSWEERVAYRETTHSHIEEYVGVGNSPEGHDDGVFEISCINGRSPKLHIVPEISSSSLEPCISGGHANGNKNCSDASTEETPLVGKSNEDNNSKEGLEIPCADETLGTFVSNEISHEHVEVPNIDEIEASQAKLSKLEESSESYETQCSQMMLTTVHREVETYDKDKLFSFVDEACPQNVKEIITEVSSETVIHEEIKKFGTEEKAGPHEDFQEEDVYWDAGSPEEEANFTPVSSNANENDKAEVLNVFVGDSKLMESDVRTCGTFAEDSDQLQESQESLGPQDLGNKMDGVEDLVPHDNVKEAKKTSLENSEKTLVEEILNHEKEGQTSSETDIIKGINDVYAEIIARNYREGNVLHSGTKITIDDYSDYTIKMSTCSKDLQSSFSENAESVSTQMPDESTPFLENVEEDRRKADRDFSTNRDATLEGQKAGSKMEEVDGKDRISSANLKDQQSFAEDGASNFVQKSREETPDVQRIEGRDVRKTEREIEKVSLRPDEDKERECKIEKEQTKERPRKELEEEKERERERAKDRLAVQRATREAHERAFAEARAKAERIALERITSSRQRASAEAREKEDKASAEAATEKTSREARIKAERAAVERATAEARERAIEKAKAAADAKERMEKFRSSFKDSFKATDQDVQFQKTASNNYGRSTDSCNQVAEVESALRHKARSERHQRTSERAEKALAEKNMRDMLVQREQAEKHRLAEFLDPEVKRWSNGKEGNLRALLSTLQYILGSDSCWQPVPLTDLITAAAVKKAYRRATLCVHPDKLQQRGATIRQKYICEKVFDLLKEAWNKFNSAER